MEKALLGGFGAWKTKFDQQHQVRVFGLRIGVTFILGLVKGIFCLGENLCGVFSETTTENHFV